MSDYVSLTETKTLLARILAVYEVSGTVDDAHLTLIIDASEGMVNAACASRYDIPITGTVAINYIRSLVIPIIRYKTYMQFSDQEDVSEGVKAEYKATMKSLNDLAIRKTSLPNVDDKTTGRASHIKISTATSPIKGY